MMGILAYCLPAISAGLLDGQAGWLDHFVSDPAFTSSSLFSAFQELFGTVGPLFSAVMDFDDRCAA